MSAPASASAIAIAAPIPLVPPVTTAVFPSSLKMSILGDSWKMYDERGRKIGTALCELP